MTALFSDEPIIISGTSETGRQFTQLWGDTKVAGDMSRILMVSMESQTSGDDYFTILHGCHTEWFELAWELFARFRSGELPVATHTIRWDFFGSKPSFAEVSHV